VTACPFVLPQTPAPPGTPESAMPQAPQETEPETAGELGA
jgi:hypothetical protein